MSMEFRFLELQHYDNGPHFERFNKVAEARRREATLLLPKGVSSQEFFDTFLKGVIAALEQRRYLPIARFCDGEYSFYSGRVTNTCWGESQSSLHAPGVEKLHLEALRLIAQEGLICPNLNLMYLGLQSDFLEYLSQRGMPLKNYAPFYFVYALLVNPLFLGSLRGRNVALVTSFTNKSLPRILTVLQAHGVGNIEVCEIPSSGVAHGEFTLNLARKADVAFVGAGTGAPLVLAALRRHASLAIDAGFVYHLWDGTFDRYERLFLNYV